MAVYSSTSSCYQNTKECLKHLKRSELISLPRLAWLISGISWAHFDHYDMVSRLDLINPSGLGLWGLGFETFRVVRGCASSLACSKDDAQERLQTRSQTERGLCIFRGRPFGTTNQQSSVWTAWRLDSSSSFDRRPGVVEGGVQGPTKPQEPNS